ncbi:MAG: hypothetical protein QXP36_01945 [Conexivisphaerales archaeon]
MAVKGKFEDKNCKIRINTVIIGEPARWLMEWKRRGLITSYTDGVIQALKALNEKMTEQDLKLIQLKNLRNNEEEL